MSLDVCRGEGGPERDAHPAPDDALYELLAHPRRSMVCSLLVDRNGPFSTTDLAAEVLAQERASPDGTDSDGAVDPDDAASAQRRRTVHIDLHHRHLPKLADFGVIDWDREAETVALADDPDVDRRRLEAFLEPLAVHRSGALFEHLAEPRRRAILEAFAECGDALAVDDLARRVLSLEREVAVDAVPDAAVERARVDLRHVHLPAMADDGLLEYDPASGRATYRGHPTLLGR